MSLCFFSGIAFGRHGIVAGFAGIGKCPAVVVNRSVFFGRPLTMNSGWSFFFAAGGEAPRPEVP